MLFRVFCHIYNVTMSDVHVNSNNNVNVFKVVILCSFSGSSFYLGVVPEQVYKVSFSKCQTAAAPLFTLSIERFVLAME